ncbi:hypothetical protein [Pseudomonas sp. GV085]|uniref:hypothetical protein n=1 Tax=Pseudomonas sp. GV085 TaxID=2135756 RepID=UPI000D3CD44B|nr:hypothetical protein [Pseudomonas sp. GV085]PTR29555.1 hypothetical protein C8K63_101443 [Pseudomonas sp. GV085]
MEMLQMRSFNSEGIEQMRDWLAQARSNSTIPIPVQLLESPSFSAEIGVPIQSEIFSAAAFQSKLTLAEAIDKAVRAAALDETSLENDQGFWSWLTLRFADKFITNKGKIGEDALWIYMPGNWRKVYRQKMAPLWLAYLAHQHDLSRLNGVLGIPVNKTGEVFEQAMSRKSIVLSPGIIELFTKLYFDVVQGGLKRGSGGKSAGSPRRLSTVLDQLSLTYDIETLGWSVLASMLPNDFKKFIPEV